MPMSAAGQPSSAPHEEPSAKALVTGSSRGIGREIATALGRSGAAVVLHGASDSEPLRRTSWELSSNGARGEVVIGDLEDPKMAPQLVDEAAEKLGGLTVLVNNAGTVIPATGTELALGTWERVLAVNLRAAVFAAQAAAVHMRKAGWGRIINISSAAADAAIPAYLAYGVSKAGLNIMTKYLASEWDTDKITVNDVSPAFVRTELAEQVFARMPELYEDQLKRIPVRRMGEPAEIAAAVVYLASRDAGFTTGEILHVDGGYLIE
jgi:NAD(P)-dependent dehydrogenase (short-subunit alcohol dehydrogenase family)